MMNTPNLNPNQGGMPIQCPQCGHQFTAQLETVIDAAYDPSAKARLLSRQTNMIQCPNCGVVMQLATPLVYHDPDKELLLVYFPQELNIPQQERERIIGEMTRQVMDNMPQEQRRGYLLNPITPLTIDGMIETILNKDGVTPEMMQAQQAKMQVIEQFITAAPDALPDLIAQHEDLIDDEFIQLLTYSAEAALASGQQQAAQAILERRNAIIQGSQYGQDALARAEAQEEIIQEVLDYLRSQGQRMSIDDFVNYLLSVYDSDDHLQAVAALARESLDYNFFQYLSGRIENADGDEAAALQTVRARLVEYAEMIDQQQQQRVQSAQRLMMDLLNAEDPDAAIHERLGFIDDFFLSVLQASVQQYEQTGDMINSARLKKLYERIIEHVQASSPPEVRFVNELMTQEDEIEARLLLSEQAAQYGEPLLEYMDALIATMDQRGAEELAAQLRDYRQAAADIIAAG
ncbi:MAG: CpXC domain-containing protein [Anaerolineales bacterium]